MSLGVFEDKWSNIRKIAGQKSHYVQVVCYGSSMRENELFKTENEDINRNKNCKSSGISGVTLKLAIDSSEDWGVAELKEGSKIERFTSGRSLDMVHRLRRDSDFVLVGKNTVLVDDCSLTVRRVELSSDTQQPTRVILDPKLSLLPCNDNKYKQYAIFNDGFNTLLYFSMRLLSPAEQIQMQLLASTSEEQQDRNSVPSDILWSKFVMLVNVDNLSVPMSTKSSSQVDDNSGGIPHPNLLLSPEIIANDLHARWRRKEKKANMNEKSHIMVEGGPMTAKAFLKSKLVDRAVIVKAPIIFEEPLTSGLSNAFLKSSGLEFLGSNNEQFDGDKVDYWSRPGLDWPTGKAQSSTAEEESLWFWP